MTSYQWPENENHRAPRQRPARTEQSGNERQEKKATKGRGTGREGRRCEDGPRRWRKGARQKRHVPAGINEQPCSSLARPATRQHAIGRSRDREGKRRCARGKRYGGRRDGRTERVVAPPYCSLGMGEPTSNSNLLFTFLGARIAPSGGRGTLVSGRGGGRWRRGGWRRRHGCFLRGTWLLGINYPLQSCARYPDW